MSKSVGNVVDPFFAIDRFGVEPLRYFMAYDGGIRDDASYDNSFVTARYKKGLYGGIGNLANRILSYAGWNVRRAVKTSYGQGKASLSSTRPHRKLLAELPDEVSSKFDALDSGAALRAIMEAIFEVSSCTEYMQALISNTHVDERLHHSRRALEALPGERPASP